MMLGDYLRAIGVSRRQAGNSAPSAAVEVVYARFVRGIGPRYHSLFSLYRIPVTQWSEYVLDSESNPIIRSINSPAARALATNKYRFYEHMSAIGAPVIPVLGLIQAAAHCRSNVDADNWLSRDDFVNSTARRFDRLFIKPIDGGHGFGAFMAKRYGEAWDFADRQSQTAAELFDYCANSTVIESGWVVQPTLLPHTDIRCRLSPNALATVRVVTMLETGRGAAITAVLRIPAGTSVVDNFSEGASGNVVAPIDIESGVLGPALTSLSRDWPEVVCIDCHPDTGRRIAGFALPYWQELLAVVKNAQEHLPGARTVGWDVAITNDGPVIVEANTGYDVNLLQVAHQCGLRKLLARVHSLPSWQEAVTV